MTYRTNDVLSKWLDRANGTRANDHRANGNRADVVAPSLSKYLIQIFIISFFLHIDSMKKIKFA